MLRIEPWYDTYPLEREAVKGFHPARETKKFGHLECKTIELEALENFKSGDKTMEII